MLATHVNAAHALLLHGIPTTEHVCGDIEKVCDAQLVVLHPSAVAVQKPNRRCALAIRSNAAIFGVSRREPLHLEVRGDICEERSNAVGRSGFGRAVEELVVERAAR